MFFSLANKQDLPTALSKASLYEALKINQLVPPNSSITSNAKDAGESKPEDWWVGIYPCIANVTDPNISGIDFANGTVYVGRMPCCLHPQAADNFVIP